MSTSQQGGIDPTVLGNYFARNKPEQEDVFYHFLRFLDFRIKKKSRDSLFEEADQQRTSAQYTESHVMDIVSAMRLLFRAFKPPGESQVIDRMLMAFAAHYFTLLENENIKGLKLQSAISLHTLCFSIVVINNEFHNVGMRRKNVTFQQRTVENFTKDVRLMNCSEEECDDAYIAQIFEHVKAEELQMTPLPRIPFNCLKVSPDIEGWLVVILKGRPAQRFWAVIAISRLYLFSDQDDLNAFLCINLKGTSVKPVSKGQVSRLLEKKTCYYYNSMPKNSSVDSLFLLGSPNGPVLDTQTPIPLEEKGGSETGLNRLKKTFFGANKLRWILCQAESKEMMEKWSFIHLS